MHLKCLIYDGTKCLGAHNLPTSVIITVAKINWQFQGGIQNLNACGMI